MTFRGLKILGISVSNLFKPERGIPKPYFGVNVGKDDTITIIMNENDKLL